MRASVLLLVKRGTAGGGGGYSLIDSGGFSSISTDISREQNATRFLWRSVRIASIQWAVIVWILFACLRSSSWLRVFRPPRGKAARDGVAPAIILKCSSPKEKEQNSITRGRFCS